MLVGIVSDIHDNLWNLKPAIAWLNENTSTLVCCGDLCSPFVIDELKKYAGPVHIVFGNNDADLFRITRKSDSRVQVHGEFFETEIEGKKLAVNHFDYLARPIAQSGKYDIVCFGHNHRISVERYGSTICVNPGPVMGAAFGPDGWEDVDATYATYDTQTGAVRSYRVVDRSRIEPGTAY